MKLIYAKIPTPIGPLIAISDEQALLLLDFFKEEKPFLPESRFKLPIEKGSSSPIASIEKELDAYFSKKLQTFQTPLKLQGTSFQLQVWQELRNISHGKTCSYADLAKAIGRPTAFRAVARANATNKFPILIPCHRVIRTGGNLGGYSKGLHRKQWLLNHEKNR